jgi:hypothetical protein
MWSTDLDKILNKAVNKMSIISSPDHVSQQQPAAGTTSLDLLVIPCLISHHKPGELCKKKFFNVLIVYFRQKQDYLADLNQKNPLHFVGSQYLLGKYE